MSQELFQVRDLRNGAWYWIHTKALEIISQDLGSQGVAVYNWLAAYSNSSTQQCHPSIATLAKRCQVSTRTVKRIIRQLEQLGLISIKRDEGKINTYCLLKTYGLKVEASPLDNDWCHQRPGSPMSPVSPETQVSHITSDTRNPRPVTIETQVPVTPGTHEQELVRTKISEQDPDIDNYVCNKEHREIGKREGGEENLTSLPLLSPGNNHPEQPESPPTCESERPTTEVLANLSNGISNLVVSEANPEEKTILSLLKNIPGYPFDPQKDLILIRDLLADFSHLDIPEELKRWKAWLLGNDFKKKKINYRSRLRNWLSISSKYQHERKNSACWKRTKRERIVDDDPYGDIPTREIPYGDPRLDNRGDPYEDIPTRETPYGDPRLDNRGDPYEDIPTREIPYGDPRLDNRDKPDEDIYGEEVL